MRLNPRYSERSNILARMIKYFVKNFFKNALKSRTFSTLIFSTLHIQYVTVLKTCSTLNLRVFVTCRASAALSLTVNLSRHSSLAFQDPCLALHYKEDVISQMQFFVFSRNFAFHRALRATIKLTLCGTFLRGKRECHAFFGKFLIDEIKFKFLSKIL